jgi:uncharacterized alkaline shock family protein YloU
MNMVNRLLLAICMIVLMLISIILILMPFGIIPSELVNSLIIGISSNYIYAISGAVLLVISLNLLLSGALSKKRSNVGIVKTSELGEIKISMDTFVSLSLAAIKQLRGVRDVKVRISIVDYNLMIWVSLSVLPDINIPGIVNEVQGRIKSYVENITEVNVQEVRVSVDNIAVTSISRVE